MVHSIRSGKMAAIARLLAPGSISQTITEDVGYSKLAAQYTHRDLCEADEANLLDEDDVDVFGLKPTTDPLNLVCCNACKKPVRASHFAAHAELCRSLTYVEEIVPTSVEEIVPKKERNGTKRKKPPKKERKKSSKVSAVQPKPALTRERKPLESIGSHGSGPSSSHLKEQMLLISSSSNEANGNAPSVDGLLIMDSSKINAGFVDRAAGAEETPIKRSKLLAADSQLILDHLGTAKGVTKNMFINTQEAFTCEYQNGSKIGSGKTSEHVAGNQMPRQVYNCYSPTRGVPAPLATKIYYSQRNQRLRSAVSDLYKASTDECWSDFGCDAKGVQFVRSGKTISFAHFTYLRAFTVLEQCKTYFLQTCSACRTYIGLRVLQYHWYEWLRNYEVNTMSISAIKPGGVAPTQTEFWHSSIDSPPALSVNISKSNCTNEIFSGPSSVFQLVAEGGGTTAEHEEVISQFWKVDKDVFTKDNLCLISAFQAFAIRLGSFDTEIACE